MCRVVRTNLVLLSGSGLSDCSAGKKTLRLDIIRTMQIQHFATYYCTQKLDATHCNMWQFQLNCQGVGSLTPMPSLEDRHRKCFSSKLWKAAKLFMFQGASATSSSLVVCPTLARHYLVPADLGRRTCQVCPPLAQLSYLYTSRAT